MLKEPVAARVMQGAILVAAVLLLSSALVSPRAGPIIVGVMILLTAFPPVRGPVDEWLTGTRRGKVAEQAAAMRMTLGAVVVLAALLSAFTHL
jgi:hypothetical protein